MTNNRLPTSPRANSTGADSNDAETPCDSIVQDCQLRCPTMEIEVAGTPQTTDDQVALHTSDGRPVVHGRVRATSPSAAATVVLTNPDGRLRFSGAESITISVPLRDDGGWSEFNISGETASQTAGDALIEAHCAAENGPVRATRTMTVCALAMTSQTTLTQPPDRSRTRLGAAEEVTLTATGGVGSVTWSIVAGHGNLSLTAGSPVIYTAHGETEDATVEVRDSIGCMAKIAFNVECGYLLAPARLRAVFPDAPDERIAELTAVFNEAYDRFFLDTCLRRAHFFAQVREEVGSAANPRRENLNYSAERLPQIFGYFRTHSADALLYGRTAAHAANQEAIANRAYANRLGNGNIASGDGWAFRGSGYIQLTGRSNYTGIQAEIDSRFPNSGIDLVANPDDAITTRGGLISAMAFWSINSLYTQADTGATDAAVDSVTSGVNRYTDSYANRRRNFHDITAPAFHVDQTAEAAGE